MKLKRKGAAVLSQVAQPVPHGEDVSELVAGMWVVLRQHNGAGLAAIHKGARINNFGSHVVVLVISDLIALSIIF